MGMALKIEFVPKQKALYQLMSKLNEAEMAQLNADASKALEARRAARREARKAARGNNDMPPPPAPVQEGGDDE